MERKEERRATDAVGHRIEAALDRVTTTIEEVKRNTELIRAQLHLNVNFLQGIQAPMLEMNEEISGMMEAMREMLSTLKPGDEDANKPPDE